jgi:miniconductance mechanosensitive channel
MKEVDTEEWVNGRRLTNLGTFRAYLVAYLRHHPMIHQELTFLVRQLKPSPEGVPIEIYVFSKDQRWVQYEDIQSDIFDHILSVLPMFDLRAYQSPSGADLRALKQGAVS